MKGKTTITLTDVKTGEVEVYEDHNLITNAISKILNLGVTHQAMFPNTAVLVKPAWSLASGLYLFDNIIDESNLVIPAEANAVGYGAYNYVDSLGIPAMGNYNVSESEETDTYIKMVWDFATDKANGDIGSICLGHPMGAKMCLGGLSDFTFAKTYSIVSAYLLDSSLSYSAANYGFMSTVAGINYAPKIRYFENTGIMWVVGTDATGVHIYAVDTKSRNVGLLDTVAEIVAQKDFTSQANYYFAGYDRTTKKAYFVSSQTWNAGASITVATVDLSSDDLSLATVSTATRVNRSGKQLAFGAITNDYFQYSVVYDGYLYNCYNQTSTLVKINLSNDTNYEVITPTDGVVLYNEACSGLAEFNGLIYGVSGQTYVYNPVTGKMRGFLRTEYASSGSRYTSKSQIGDDGIVGSCAYTYGSDTHYFGIFHGTLATINNLETPVTKTPDKTMKITYTLEIST